MKIAFGCDHGGFPLKEAVFEAFKGYPDVEIVDCGTFVSDAQARGIEKKTCCDALIRECVGYVEEILKKNGVI